MWNEGRAGRGTKARRGSCAPGPVSSTLEHVSGTSPDTQRARGSLPGWVGARDGWGRYAALVSTPRALAGFRVLDLSRILAGPYCTMLLGDQGADVVKVEKPDTGDDTRRWGPPFVGTGADAESAYYLCCNRNKRSLTLDLKAPTGQALARELALAADVVVHNFMPGTLERLGLGHEALLAANPRLVVAAISAYGQDGPYADRPGYDMVLAAVGGMMHITGERGGGPVKVGVALTDVLTGVHAAGAITTALLHRERTGAGQHLDISLLDVGVASLANVAANWTLAGQEATRWGTAHPSLVPYQVFRTQDRPLAIAAANERMWADLCGVLERPEWIDDPRFKTNATRVEHRDVLVPAIEAVLATRTAADWLQRLTAAKLPAGPVNDMQHLFDDPQVQHRELVRTVPHPTLGDLAQIANPIRASLTPPAIDRHPPRLGEHTDEVLADWLELTAERRAGLRAEGIH